MKKFGIKQKSTGKMLMFDVYSSIFEDSEMNYYGLSTCSCNDTLWLVDTKEAAQRAIDSRNVPYYNANYSTPEHNYSPNDLEIVEVDILVSKELSEVDYVHNLKLLKQELVKSMQDMFDLLNKENVDELRDIYYADGKGTIKLAYIGTEFMIDMGAIIHDKLIEMLDEEIKDLE